MTTTQEAPSITAEMVYAEAVTRYGADAVGVEELGTTYESLLTTAQRDEHAVYYTPQVVAEMISRFAMRVGLKSIGPEPEQVMRITALDPSCGAGIFLVNAARLLSHAYASRLVGGEPAGDLMLAVMPRVILNCIFGIDLDPIAVDLAKLSLSLETAGTLTPAMLDRHVIRGDPLAGPLGPPAMEDKRAGRDA